MAILQNSNTKAKENKREIKDTKLDNQKEYGMNYTKFLIDQM